MGWSDPKWRLKVTYENGQVDTTEHAFFTELSDSIFLLGEEPLCDDEGDEIEVTDLSVERIVAA